MIAKAITTHPWSQSGSSALTLATGTASLDWGLTGTREARADEAAKGQPAAAAGDPRAGWPEPQWHGVREAQGRRPVCREYNSWLALNSWWVWCDFLSSVLEVFIWCFCSISFSSFLITLVIWFICKCVSCPSQPLSVNFPMQLCRGMESLSVSYDALPTCRRTGNRH